MKSAMELVLLLVLLLPMVLCAGVKEQRSPVTVELPGTECGDGTQSFMRVVERPQAKNLFIFLNGGGACWDKKSCGCDTKGQCDGGLATAGLTRPSPSGYGEWDSGEGWRNSADPTNPIRQGYSVVEVPYCTGDVYIGNRTANYGSTSKEINVRHRGHHNMGITLKEIAKRFPSPEKIVFMGCSAGGIGVTYNVHQLKEVYPTTPSYVISDSGLPFKAPHIHANRLTEIFHSWGADKTVPTQDSGKDGIFDLGDMVRFNGEKHPEVRWGFISTYGDLTMTFFAHKVGSPNAGEAVLNNIIDVAENDLASPNSQVFYLEGTRHCFNGKSAGAVQSKGISFSQWTHAMIQDEANWHSIRPDEDARTIEALLMNPIE